VLLQRFHDSETLISAFIDSDDGDDDNVRVKAGMARVWSGKTL